MHIKVLMMNSTDIKDKRIMLRLSNELKAAGELAAEEIGVCFSVYIRMALQEKIGKATLRRTQQERAA